MINLPPVYKTIENVDIATFNDAQGDAPILGTFGIDLVQDLHGYDHPWPGGAGKNKWSIGDFSKDASALYISKTIATLSAGTYTISALVTSGDTTKNQLGISFRGTTNVKVYLDANTGNRTNATFTLENDCTTIYIYGGYGTTIAYAGTLTDVQIESGSSATSYAPYENICPITGWTEAIIKDSKDLLTVYNATYANGYINNSGNWQSNNTYQYQTNFIPANPQTTYTLQFNKTVATELAASVGEYGQNGNFIRRTLVIEATTSTGTKFGSITTGNGTAFIRVTSIPARSNARILEEGSSASDPTTATNTYTVSFPNPPETVYSGTLTVNKDGTGEIVDNLVHITIDSNSTIYQHNTYSSQFAIKLSSHTIKGTAQNQAVACNQYATGEFTSAANRSNGKLDSYLGTFGNQSGQNEWVAWRDDRFSTISEVEAWVAENPIDLVAIRYSNAITNLTDVDTITSLNGTNNIFCDTGSVLSLEYEEDRSTVMDAYWDAIKSGAPTHVRMVFGYDMADEDQAVVDDRDIDVRAGLTVTDMLNGETDLTFGKAVSKQLTTNILITERTAYLPWTSEFRLDMGVEIGGSTVWTTIGYFSGTRPNNVSTLQTVEFTAYDRMSLFDQLADEFWSGLDFTTPLSLEDIYDALCTYCGVQNVSGDELSASFSRTYSAAPMDLTGYTCRDVLAWIAEAVGCYARITSAGYCKLLWYGDVTSHVITRNEEFHVEHADLYSGMIWNEFDEYTWNEAEVFTWNEVEGYYGATYGVRGVKVKQTNLGMDIDYPTTQPWNVYTIMDNPFLQIEDLVQDPITYVKPIYDRLIAFGGQLPMNADCVGCWCIEAGDIITIHVADEEIHLPVFCKTMRWNGALRDEYETTGEKFRKVINDSQKQRVINNRNIKLYVDGNYYGIVNGIDIDENGVTITGSKINIISGSSIDNYGNIDVENGAKIDIKSGGDIDLESGGDINVKSGGKIDVASGGDIDLESGGDINVKSGGKVNVKSGGKTIIESSGGLDVNSGGNIDVKGGAAIDIESTGNVNVKSGGKLNIKSGGKTILESGGGLDINSGGTVSVKSGGNLNVASGGNVNIQGTGKLIMTGSTVSIKSNSTFDVDATNFQISSKNKKMVTGDWTFDTKGLKHKKSGRSETFQIAHTSDKLSNMPGLFYVVNDNDGQVHLVAKSASYSATWILKIPNDGTVGRLMPGVTRGQIGEIGHIVASIYGEEFFGNSNKILLTPNTSDQTYYLYITGVSSNGRIRITSGTSHYAELVGYVSAPSSRDVKHNIQVMDDVGEIIDQLEPVTFVYNNDVFEKKQFGLIYEDTVNVLPEICTQIEEQKTLEYTALIPVLLKEIQSLRARVKALEERRG